MKPLNLSGPVAASKADLEHESAERFDRDQPTEEPPPEDPLHDDPPSDETDEAVSDRPHPNRSGAGQRPNTSRRTRHNGQRRQHVLPTTEQIGATLANMPLLIARGVLSTAQANSMLAVLKTLLNATSNQHSGNQAGRLDASHLHNAVERHPEILHALEPLLSDEQLAELLDAD